MVGVVDAAVAVEDDLRVGRQHRVGPERPDLADELLAQGEVVGERPVGLVEERHARVAHDLGRGPLLALAERGQLERVGSGSSPPASPLVQHTSQPTDPSSIQRAAVAAGPKSASSGWATMTMNRSGRQA